MTGRKWWAAPSFVVSSAFLGVIVVVGAVTLFAGGHDMAASSPKRAPLTVRADVVDGCPRVAGDQRVPLQAPPAHWDRIGDQRVPSSTLAGPARRAGHIRTCYAHSPTGAVFAAYGFFSAQWTYPGDTVMLRALTASGQARDEALKRGGSPPHDPSWSAALVGFRVEDYSPHAATVTIGVLAAPSGSAVNQGQVDSRLAAVPIKLRWERDDWKIVCEPQGFEPELIDSLAGLVPWAAP